ncbi:DUF6174 domain-containing protein [Streptomyces sp. NPDC059168]|uniref:DUF6174 domain-containing protein n=1 Tax=Streptomyces sp. NPDC059168 TaxID=3346753 RepID=UPI00369CA094
MTPVRSTFRSPLPRLAMVAGLVCAAAACGEPTVPTRPAQTATAWREPPAYAYTLRSTGGERELIGSFRVWVRAGQVVRAAGLDAGSRAVLRRSPTIVPTIGMLVREMERARREGADRAEAQYAAAGYPRRITVDPSATAADDEADYEISDCTPEARHHGAG